MPKKIVAWVNKYDKKQLEKLTDNIYFANSLKDFESNLVEDIIPLFSLGLAGRTIRKTNQIIDNHLNLKFYFLDKRKKQWILTDPDWKVRVADNIENLAITHQEIIEFSNTSKLPDSFLRRSQF